MGEREGDTLDVTLDYVLPAYRDSRLGRWLYGPGSGVFRAASIGRLTASAAGDQHRQYLVRVGFAFDEAAGAFVRDL
jgi:hypothetical protein